MEIIKSKIINIRKMFSVIHWHLIVHLQYQLARTAFSSAQFYFLLNYCDHWPSMCFDILDDVRMFTTTCLSVGVDIYIASVSWHCLSRVDTWWPFVLNERFSFLFSRLIEVERFPCWGFETEIHMHRIRPRSMMRLQWSTLPMSFSSLWLVSLSTRWSMKSTRTGTHGYFLLWQVVCTCLVRN